MSSVAEYAETIAESIKRITELKEASKTDPQAKNKIRELIKLIDEGSTKIYSAIGDEGLKFNVAEIPIPKKVTESVVSTEEKTSVKTIVAPEFTSQKFKILSEATKKRYIEELSIDREQIERFVKEQKKKEEITLKKEDYSIYKPSEVGKTANRYAKHYADLLVASYPKLFTFLLKSFEKVNMPLLSRTYISMMIFFSILSLPIAFVFFFFINLSFGMSMLFVILMTVLAPLFTFIAFYFYPASLEGERNKRIQNELPFALVYMSAIAGSGANPISIFELLAESDDYPELKKEIKKILNYVNLFGYDLPTALANVARATPSEKFSELLNGMISTIETGGDLRDYLKTKAEDALNSYRLERKQKVEALATYSEVYTAILIAAPLLLIVTLAIINSIGGEIGGISVSTMSWGGILVALPLLNLGFMVFVNKVAK